MKTYQSFCDIATAIIKGKDLIKIIAELNQINNRKPTEKNQQHWKLTFWKDTQIRKPLVMLKKREKAQLNKIRNERGGITIDALEMKRIKRN